MHATLPALFLLSVLTLTGTEPIQTRPLTGKGNEAVYWGATWCDPCKVKWGEIERAGLSPLVTKYDVDEKPRLAKHYEVDAIPAVRLLRDGVWQDALDMEGGEITTEKLKNWLAQGDSKRLADFHFDFNFGRPPYRPPYREPRYYSQPYPPYRPYGFYWRYHWHFGHHHHDYHHGHHHHGHREHHRH